MSEESVVEFMSYDEPESYVTDTELKLTGVRKPRYNRAGSIDCEVEHPQYGWVPFTAMNGTTESHVQAVYDDIMAGKYGPILAAAGKTVAQLKADIAAKRYEMETSGIVLNGMDIDTGRDSQALITGAVLEAMLDPDYVCNWKTPSGFIPLTAPVLIAIARKIRRHVQLCFDREGVLATAADNGTFNEAMLLVGWPNGDEE